MPPIDVLGCPDQAARRIVDCHQVTLNEGRQILVDGLKSGEVEAFWSGPRADQRTRADPAELTDDAIEFDDSEEAAPDLAPALIQEGSGGFSIVILGAALEINLISLDRFCERIFGQPIADRPPPRDRGGRPAEYDWRRATRQVLLRVQEYGWPATKAQLIAELVEWFARKYSEPPDESTVRRFVSAIWPQGRCELRPCE